mmetsp:Transcript_4688/g.13874  ORF Transcript_4688/g.13874 Transcript_4688/m.13874 type:complete len:250 (+) Transcript_4688:119-868(+)|eukprot:3603161-Prymnesium_polylepis.5
MAAVANRHPPNGTQVTDVKNHLSDTTFCDAFREVLSLRIATTLMTSKAAVKAAAETIGLISALLLTMVTLTQNDQVGDKLPGVDVERAGQVFTALAFLSITGFFCSTMMSAFICALPGLEPWLFDSYPLNPTTGVFYPCATALFTAFLETDDAVLEYVTRCGYYFKANLLSFIMGLVFYLTVFVWQCLTFLPLRVSAACIAAALGVFSIAVCGTIHSVEATYDLTGAQARPLWKMVGSTSEGTPRSNML